MRTLGLLLLVLCLAAPAGAIKRDFQVNNDDDDAEETESSGSMDLGSSDLELISEGGTDQIVGIRFRDVSIPQGTTITSAVLEFETDETDSGSTSLTLEGEDSDDAAIFTSTNSDISDRTTTTASVSWSPGAWNTVSERHQSPDVSSIVQEIVDRGGWSSGNSMVFIITGSGERTAESHDGEDDAAPILRVEWDGQESIPGGEVCYGVADSNDHFVLIDTDDGTVDTDVGDIGVGGVEAITLDPDDFAVYGADEDRLGRINVDTGELIHLTEDFGTGGGSAGDVTFDDVDSLAFDPATGILWGVDARSGSDALFQIDITTGAHVADAFGSGTDYLLITGTGIGTTIDDIAIDPDDGTLYASDTTNSQLITVNTSTGVGSVVGDFGSTLDMEGLGFRFDGVLHGTVGQRVYSINTSTGAATQVGSGDTLTVGDDYESFECHFTATSRAVIRAMDRVRVDGGAAVRWRTESEDGTAGFFVYRWQDGDWQEVPGGPIPALSGSPQGGVYVLEDPGGGEATRYAVVEVEAGGRLLRHGPFPVGPPAADLPSDPVTGGAWARPHPRRGETELEAELEATVEATVEAPVEAAVETAVEATVGAAVEKLAPAPTSRARRQAKIRVGASGMYRVGAAAIGSAMGLSEQAVRRLLDGGRLALEHAGRAVAWAPDGDGLLFYGQAVAEPLVETPLAGDPFAPENVYRLGVGRGLLMENLAAPLPGLEPIEEHTFRAVRHEEVDIFAGIAASPDPDGDYWFWHAFSAGTPGFESRTFSVDLPAVSGDQAAEITIDLLGVSDAGAHLIALELNGRPVGERSFTGLGRHRLAFSLPGKWLLPAANQFELTALLGPGTAFSFLYHDSVDIAYRRFYRSSDTRTLAFRARAESPVRLHGFASPKISVFDIDDPLRPKRLPAPGPGHGAEQAEDSTYSLVTLGLGGDRRGLATTPEGLLAAEIEPWSEASPALADPGRRADYLILAPAHLLPASRQLAEHRRDGGLETELVELEHVYNEFGDGLETPWAIRNFLHTAVDTWQLPPRYILLVGRGTFDHKDILGEGDQLLPPLLAPGPGGIFSSQSRYLPETASVAIGRLPVTRGDEILAYLDRLRGYEGQPASSRGLILADRPSADADFAADAARLRQAASRAVATDLLEMNGPAADDELRSALAAGLDWLTFVGHGATTSWGADGFLTPAELDTPSGHRPIVLAATCLTNRSDLPGLPSLGEALLLSPRAGAMAVIAPAGTTAHHDVLSFLEHFWQAVADGEGGRLGDLLIEARRDFREHPGSASLLSLLSLLGDPALELP